MTSTLPAIDSTTDWISFVLDTVYSLHLRPFASISFLAILAWNNELSSAEQYKIPTVFASGNNFDNKSICSLTGVKSDVPVTLLPGFLLESTSPEFSGSVTAVTTIGISVVLPAIA